MKTIKQRINFNAPPSKIYNALMDSKRHATFTNSSAKISKKIGGKFEVYDGYATGKNIILIKDKKIVQSWRAQDWPKGHLSRITLILNKTKTGTRVNFTQTSVPDKEYKSISKGWHEFYWIPLRQYLEK